MRADLPSLLPLICPACRHVSARGRELYTLSVVQVLRATGGDDDGSPEDIEEGTLRCDNPACARRYPILHGIPVLLTDLTRFAATQLHALSCFHEPETLAMMALDGPDDSALPRMLDYLSIYLDAHFGDYAMPPPDGPEPGCGGTPLWQAVEARKLVPVDRAIELGCGVGRGLHALSQTAELTVGVEMNFAALLYARWLLRGETVRYARRTSGRHYSAATVHVPAVSTTSVQLVCGDALDPPLAPDSFSREYWSSLEYHEVQLVVSDWKSSRIFLALNELLPTMLRCLIFAALPSVILMLTCTRLRSRLTTEVLTETLYLPRL